MVSFVFCGQVIINCLEINLKVESSRFLFKYDKNKNIWTQQFSGYILYITVLLSNFTVIIYFDIN